MRHAVGRAARCGSLTLLAAGESTIPRPSIVVTLQAVPIIVSCDRGYVHAKMVADVERARKRVRIFLSHVELPPHLTVGPNVWIQCERAHIGGCKFLRLTGRSVRKPVKTELGHKLRWR
jgi:hypothetical protein